MDPAGAIFSWTVQLIKQINSLFILSWCELGFCPLQPKSSNIHQQGSQSWWGARPCDHSPVFSPLTYSQTDLDKTWSQWLRLLSSVWE